MKPSDSSLSCKACEFYEKHIESLRKELFQLQMAYNTLESESRMVVGRLTGGKLKREDILKQIEDDIAKGIVF